MRALGVAAIMFLTPITCSSVEFLGVNLCTGLVDTAVSLPADSPLTLVSAERGKHGALVMLLTGTPSRVLDDVDDLMAGYTGGRGTGSEQQLQWSGNSLTGYAKVIKKGHVALVVSSSDDCLADVVPETVVAPQVRAAAPVAQGGPAPTSEISAAGTATSAAAATAAAVPSEPVAGEVAVGFRLTGELKHAAAGDGWVDVMGVVANPTADSYRLATFDVALFDAAGGLICVDTISVSQLQSGRTRAFRDAIQCPDYVSEQVARYTFEFAGGY